MARADPLDIVDTVFTNAVLPSPTTADGDRRPRPWQAVAAATFAIAWGGNEFTPLLVMYRDTAGFSPLTVDLLLFAYVLGIVPALLVGGALSDRLGRRPLMMPAPVLAAVGSLILAFGAHSAPVLAVGRVFSGLALGLAMAVLAACGSEKMLPSPTRAWFLGYSLMPSPWSTGCVEYFFQFRNCPERVE